MATTSENAVPGSHDGATKWKIDYGDTLTGISIAVYSTSQYWMYIFNRNRNIIHNPDSLGILVGSYIDIPPIRRNPINSQTAVANSHKGATTWIVQYGDTLTGISKAVYGDTKLWESIYKANGEIIGSDPNTLKSIVGYPLVIPQDPSQNENVPPNEFMQGTNKKTGNFYSLQILHGEQLFEPAVEGGITIEWSRVGSPGKLQFSVPKEATISYSEGDQVRFYANNTLLFVGYVFTKERTKKGIIQTTCYDQTRYFKNKFAYVFQEQTASEIVKSICKDYNLEIGTIQDTEFKIPSMAEENSEAFDIILNATQETLANTGNMFILFDSQGKVCLVNALDMKTETLVCDKTAEDFEYKTSIDEQTYNRIVLYYKPANTGGTTTSDGSGGGDGSAINIGGKLPPYVRQYPLYQFNPNGRGIEGQCTWYAGDRLAQFGVSLPVAMGNGGQWADTAASLGYPFYWGKPFVGAGACMSTLFGVTGISWLGAEGHIAIVEEVYSDGSFLASEFWGYHPDYVVHTMKYTAAQAANMKFIDFGVRVNSSGSKVSKDKAPQQGSGVTSVNSSQSVNNVLGSNVTRWKDYVLQASAKYNIPADLIGAVIYHESSGVPTAVSYAGAAGLMQLMPATASNFGCTDRFNPQQNIDAGTACLKYLSEYEGRKRSLKEILRGYWGGQGNMDNSNLDSYYYDIMKIIPNEFTGLSGTTTVNNSISSGENAVPQVFTAEDKKSIERWGVLQYFESVDSDSIGQVKADSLLELYNRKTRKFTVTNAFGDPNVRGGTMIPVNLNLGDIIVNNYMLVNKVTHRFYKDTHFMDLDLEGAWDEV